MSVDSLLQENAHLWQLKIPVKLSTHFKQQEFSCLSMLEKQKYNAFRFERDRNTYLFSHAYLRKILARYVELNSKNIEYVYNKYGRPELLRSINKDNLRFNLSHTNGMVVYIICYDRDCGIDVEYISPLDDLAYMAERVFSNSEAKIVKELIGRQQLDQFYLYWTLKESYIKARGMGLQIPLDQFSFILDAKPRIKFSDHILDYPNDWCFNCFRPTNEYIISTSIKQNEFKFSSILQKDSSLLELPP